METFRKVRITQHFFAGRFEVEIRCRRNQTFIAKVHHSPVWRDECPQMTLFGDCAIFPFKAAANFRRNGSSNEENSHVSGMTTVSSTNAWLPTSSDA